MAKISLNEAIDEFLKSGRYLPTPADKKAAERIFDNNRFTVRYEGGAEGCASKPGIYAKYLETGIRDYVKSYGRDKDAVIDIFKKFVDFLRVKYQVNTQIKWPPIRVTDTEERIRYMNNYLQEPGARISKLSNILWVNDRTIENDYSRLNGSSFSELSKGGLPFSVPVSSRSLGRVEFESTASIISLTANISEVIAVLEGLRMASDNPYHAAKAKRMARIIWQQLSDYAKGRLHQIAEEGLYDCDPEWLEEIGREAEKKSFHTESENLSDDVFSVLAHCMKNSRDMRIEYREEDGDVRVYQCSGRNGKLRRDSISVRVLGGPVQKDGAQKDGAQKDRALKDMQMNRIISVEPL